MEDKKTINFRDNALALKTKVSEGVQKWMDERIDQLAADNPILAPTKKYLKRGVHNMAAKEDERLSKAIEDAMLFVADENGNYNIDMLFDDVMSMLKNMPETPFNLGLLKGTFGKGVIRIMMPDNPLAQLFLGDIGAIKFTENDFAKLKVYLQ